MTEPNTVVSRPANVLVLLGGLVATLLLSAVLYVAPALGLAFVDLPALIGGIFTGGPEVAFWLGYALFFVGGVFIIAPILIFVWRVLPGASVGFVGALIKGVLWGLILWAVTGLLLPVLGAINRLGPQELTNPGFFAAAEGAAGVAVLLIGMPAYGLALSLIAAMGQGIHPIRTVGWRGYRKGSPPEATMAAFEREHGPAA